MPGTAADLLSRPSDFAAPRVGTQEFQGLDPDLSSRRDARGRFATGHSGNPGGRPRGIRNPKRRVPDVAARPLSAQALSDLLDRKPHLLRALAVQLLPPPLKPIDPAERLGIDLASSRTVEDVRKLFARVWTAISRGEIAPVEGARVVRRLRGRLHVLRRFARLGKAMPLLRLTRKRSRRSKNSRVMKASVSGRSAPMAQPAS